MARTGNPFQLNLPIVPIADVAFHKREQELVVATQGRAFYIFDDLPLLYQLNGSVARPKTRTSSSPKTRIASAAAAEGGGGRGGGRRWAKIRPAARWFSTG